MVVKRPEQRRSVKRRRREVSGASHSPDLGYRPERKPTRDVKDKMARLKGSFRRKLGLNPYELSTSGLRRENRSGVEAAIDILPFAHCSFIY
jgi:hypothetical protein